MHFQKTRRITKINSRNYSTYLPLTYIVRTARPYQDIRIWINLVYKHNKCLTWRVIEKHTLLISR
jgi:hypothetical protein